MHALQGRGVDTLVAKAPEDRLDLGGTAHHPDVARRRVDGRAQRVAVVAVIVRHDDDREALRDRHELLEAGRIAADQLVRRGQALAREHLGTRVDDDDPVVEQAAERRQRGADMSRPGDEQRALSRVHVQEHGGLTPTQRVERILALLSQHVAALARRARAQRLTCVGDHFLFEDAAADGLDRRPVGHDEHPGPDLARARASRPRDRRDHERSAVAGERRHPVVELFGLHAWLLAAS